jgi:predicted SAM-dependent methyltransferase
MEHVANDLRCMQELYRIMKPGGWGIMQVPIDSNRDETYEDASITTPEEREKHFWQYDHVRLYGNNYPKRLAEAGFNVETFDIKDHISAEQLERFRLQKNELLYVVSKPV